jgi:hypothetical protein
MLEHTLVKQSILWENTKKTSMFSVINLKELKKSQAIIKFLQAATI